MWLSEAFATRVLRGADCTWLRAVSVATGEDVIERGLKMEVRLVGFQKTRKSRFDHLQVFAFMHNLLVAQLAKRPGFTGPLGGKRGNQSPQRPP